MFLNRTAQPSITSPIHHFQTTKTGETQILQGKVSQPGSHHIPATAAQTTVGAQVTFGQVPPQVRLHGLNCGGGELAVLAAQHTIAHHGVARARGRFKVRWYILKESM